MLNCLRFAHPAEADWRPEAGKLDVLYLGLSGKPFKYEKVIDGPAASLQLEGRGSKIRYAASCIWG